MKQRKIKTVYSLVKWLGGPKKAAEKLNIKIATAYAWSKNLKKPHNAHLIIKGARLEVGEIDITCKNCKSVRTTTNGTGTGTCPKCGSDYFNI
jgi:RNA polymerase subunit RPABC4/transcription elongation factor Spt4